MSGIRRIMLATFVLLAVSGEANARPGVPQAGVQGDPGSRARGSGEKAPVEKLWWCISHFWRCLGARPASAPPPPPPSPPPPPTPQEPPRPQCSPGPFIVFFEWDKSDIAPEASSILDNAISQYQNCGNAHVMLAGHADRSGSDAYNVALSQRRADSVNAYMTAHAIPAGVISTEALGESRPLVQTVDDVREVQNRRVEVTYGPGPDQ